MIYPSLKVKTTQVSHLKKANKNDIIKLIVLETENNYRIKIIQLKNSPPLERKENYNCIGREQRNRRNWKSFYKGSPIETQAFEGIRSSLFKPNPETQNSEVQEASKQNDELILPISTLATVQLNPLLVPQQSTQQLEVSAQTKLRLNPKLKMKEKHHVFVYLSEWYEKCMDNVQKLNQVATQFYSPQKQSKPDVTNLQSISQDVYQDTLCLIKNFKHQYQLNGNDQKDLVNKFFDKKYLETVLKDNKLQIQKKLGSEKLSTSNGKFNQKKN